MPPRGEGRDKDSYLSRTRDLLPVAAASAAMTVPAAVAEESIERKLLGQKQRLAPVARRAAGRAGGGLLASAAALPAYTHGIRDMQSDDKATSRSGAATVVGAAGLSGALARGIEGRSAHSGRGALRAGLGAAAVGGLISGAQGVANAKALIASQRDDKDARAKKAVSAAAPAAVGGSIGALSGAAEVGAQGKGWTSRRALARSTSRGLVGGVAGAAMGHMLKAHTEKVASLGVGPVDTETFQTYLDAYRAAAEGGGGIRARSLSLADAPISPMRRAAAAGLRDGNDMGEIRRARPPNTLEPYVLASAVAAPHLVMQALAGLPEEHRGVLIDDATDRLQVHRSKRTPLWDGLPRMKGGDPSWVASQVPGLSRGYLAASVAATALPLMVLRSATDANFLTSADAEARASFLERLGMLTGVVGAPQMLRETRHAFGQAASGAPGRAAVRLAARAAPLAAPFMAARMLRRKGE